jgi:hypothetical protein
MKLLTFKNSQVFKIALGVAIIVVGYIASVFYTQMRGLDSSVDLIKRKYYRNTAGIRKAFVNCVVSIETNRNYIITKDRSYCFR